MPYTSSAPSARKNKAAAQNFIEGSGYRKKEPAQGPGDRLLPGRTRSRLKKDAPFGAS
jgi:hypothetical protein